MGRDIRESSIQHPAADITLPVVVSSYGDYGAVALKSYRVTLACADHGGDLSKAGRDGIVTVHGDVGHGGVDIGNGAHITSPVDKGVLSKECPVADTALPVVVVSHGDHGAVGLKPHCVQFACGDLDNVRPAADTALS